MVYSQFFISYLIIDLFCLVYIFSINGRISEELGNEREIRFFRSLVITYVVFLITDAFWACGEHGGLQAALVLSAPTCIVNMISVGVMAYFWFCYAETKMGVDVSRDKRQAAINLAPVGMMLVLYLVSIPTGLLFTVAGDGRLVHGPFYGLSTAIGSIYLVVVTVHAMVLARRSKSRALRSDYYTLVTFIIAPLACAVADSVMPNMPVMAPGIFASILFVFLRTQSSHIYNDALTGLNNRRRADAYLETAIEGASEEKPVYFFVIDLNLFKQINDTYGHMEGDRALVATAEAIKSVCARHRCFAARWGGDEFVMIATQGMDDPTCVQREMDGAMRREIAGLGVAWELTASVGYAVCTSPNTSVTAITDQADRVLYKAKRRAHDRANGSGEGEERRRMEFNFDD